MLTVKSLCKHSFNKTSQGDLLFCIYCLNSDKKFLKIRVVIHALNVLSPFWIIPLFARRAWSAGGKGILYLFSSKQPSIHTLFLCTFQYGDDIEPAIYFVGQPLIPGHVRSVLLYFGRAFQHGVRRKEEFGAKVVRNPGH